MFILCYETQWKPSSPTDAAARAAKVHDIKKALSECEDAPGNPGEKDHCCMNENLQWSLICEQAHFFRMPPLCGFQTPKHFALKIGPLPRSAALGQTG